MEYYTGSDKKEKISYGKSQAYRRRSMYEILSGLRCLDQRGYMTYPRCLSHHDMVSHLYKRDRTEINCYKGVIYFTRDDDALFWIEGVLPIAYAQICYSENNWSEDTRLVASNIVQLMSTKNLLVHWNGDPTKKILIESIIH